MVFLWGTFILESSVFLLQYGRVALRSTDKLSSGDFELPCWWTPLPVSLVKDSVLWIPCLFSQCTRLLWWSIFPLPLEFPEKGAWIKKIMRLCMQDNNFVLLHTFSPGWLSKRFNSGNNCLQKFESIASLCSSFQFCEEV